MLTNAADRIARHARDCANREHALEDFAKNVSDFAPRVFVLDDWLRTYADPGHRKAAP